MAEKDDKLAYTFMVAGVILCKEGKYLLVQEKKLSVYGKWNLPAGKIDKGFSIEETAVKEAKEETGYDVKLIRKIGVYQDRVDNPAKHVFLAEIVGGELKFPEDEILDAKWFSLQEISDRKDEMRESYIQETIEELERKI
jgi:8-oxo-dGTP pyrophosphatase MutT (NUDIX family)